MSVHRAHANVGRQSFFFFGPVRVINIQHRIDDRSSAFVQAREFHSVRNRANDPRFRANFRRVSTRNTRRAGRPSSETPYVNRHNAKERCPGHTSMCAIRRRICHN